MKTAPIFVQAGTDTAAAVVTVPDEPPEGLVVVLAGTGRHNTIGGSLATLLAGRLAADGLASVRLDYPGVGDSPGVITTWTAADVRREASVTRAAVATVCDILGVTRFVGVGTCFGSRVALELVDSPGCIGAVCLAPPILDPGPSTIARRTVGRRRMLAAARSAPLVGKLLKPLARRVARAPSSRVLGLLAHLERVRMVFLYGTPKEEDHYDRRGVEALDNTLASLPEQDRARFELRLLDAGPLTIFDGLDAAAQDAIVETVALEVGGCFAGSRLPAGTHA